VETKSAAAEIDGDAREAGDGEARKSGAGGERGKSTFEVAEVLNPAIIDLESEERTARAKHAEDFGEGEILHFAGLEVVVDDAMTEEKVSLAKGRCEASPRSTPPECP
jgi:hypothetical protein